MTAFTLRSREEADFINKLQFNPGDVLPSDRERIRRKARLLQALAMEGLGQAEVMLVLEDQECCRTVRTRIIAAGDERIVLERGVSIPIRCIHKVEWCHDPASPGRH